LEANHLNKNTFIVSFQVPQPPSEVIPFFSQTLNFGLENCNWWAKTKRAVVYASKKRGMVDNRCRRRGPATA
jgi:hypothetical protein